MSVLIRGNCEQEHASAISNYGTAASVAVFERVRELLGYFWEITVAAAVSSV